MTLKCECGGTMKPARLRRYDFSGLAGLPVLLRNVPGFRCSRCNRQTLAGPIIERALHAVALQLLALEGRVTAEEARFLRHRLQLTQKELASRMGIHPVTVASWEAKIDPISPQHDHILRAMVLASLAEQSSLTARVEQLRSILATVRKSLPPKSPHHLVVAGLAS